MVTLPGGGTRPIVDVPALQLIVDGVTEMAGGDDVGTGPPPPP